MKVILITISLLLGDLAFAQDVKKLRVCNPKLNLHEVKENNEQNALLTLLANNKETLVYEILELKDGNNKNIIGTNKSGNLNSVRGKANLTGTKYIDRNFLKSLTEENKVNIGQFEKVGNPPRMIVHFDDKTGKRYTYPATKYIDAEGNQLKMMYVSMLSTLKRKKMKRKR